MAALTNSNSIEIKELQKKEYANKIFDALKGNSPAIGDPVDR
jgi:hypothetical protein